MYDISENFVFMNRNLQPVKCMSMALVIFCPLLLTCCFEFENAPTAQFAPSSEFLGVWSSKSTDESGDTTSRFIQFEQGIGGCLKQNCISWTVNSKDPSRTKISSLSADVSRCNISSELVYCEKLVALSLINQESNVFGKLHHYAFTLMSIDRDTLMLGNLMPSAARSASSRQVEEALAEHIIQRRSNESVFGKQNWTKFQRCNLQSLPSVPPDVQMQAVAAQNASKASDRKSIAEREIKLQRRNAFSAIVRALAEDSYLFSDETSFPSTTYQTEYQRLSHIMEAIQWKFYDAGLDKRLSEIRSVTLECFAILDRIEVCETNKPSGMATFLSAVAALKMKSMIDGRQSNLEKQIAEELAAQFAKPFFKRLMAEIHIPELQSMYQSKCYELRNVTAALADYARDIMPDNNLLSSTGAAMLFRPNYNGTYPSDEVAISNLSGRTLNNCVVLVKCKSGNLYSPHLHYIPVWNANQIYYLRYFLGDGALRFGNTFEQADSFEVHVYSNELEINMRRLFPQEERSSVLTSMLSGLTFSAEFLPFKSGFLIDDEAGIKISFSGVSSIRPSSCKITLIDSARNMTNSCSFKGREWKENISLSFRDARFTGINSNEASIELWFPYVAVPFRVSLK